jgi:hypothetical protein
MMPVLSEKPPRTLKVLNRICCLDRPTIAGLALAPSAEGTWQWKRWCNHYLSQLMPWGDRMEDQPRIYYANDRVQFLLRHEVDENRP